MPVPCLTVSLSHRDETDAPPREKAWRPHVTGGRSYRVPDAVTCHAAQANALAVASCLMSPKVAHATGHQPPTVTLPPRIAKNINMIRGEISAKYARSLSHWSHCRIAMRRMRHPEKRRGALWLHEIKHASASSPAKMATGCRERGWNFWTTVTIARLRRSAIAGFRRGVRWLTDVRCIPDGARRPVGRGTAVGRLTCGTTFTGKPSLST
jgi:hypothetical protein